MKTVPSLVASSTVGIAAAGLALGRPERSTPVRPTSKKRKAGDLADVNSTPKDLSSPISRPATSSTMITPGSGQSHPEPLGSSPVTLPPVIHQRPMTTSRENHNNGGGRRWSIARYTEHSPAQEHNQEEGRRDSISSRGSWIRRLSTIPISQNNSPRSSVGPDSPSIALSNNSAAPILPITASGTAQLPPNKLVKRVPSGRISTSIARSGSKSQVPTLRRPATSHQRSVTLQQQFRGHSVDSNDQFQTPPPKPSTRAINHSASSSPPPRSAWRPFFESRPTKLTKERLSGRSSDGSPQNFHSTSRRVLPDESARPSLVQPRMITVSNSSYTPYFEEDSLPVEENDEDNDRVDEEVRTSTENSDSHKRARRSLSMNFSSPAWGILRSGSLRGNKRYTEGKSGGKRYASAPVSTMPGRRATTSHGSAQNGHRAITDPTVFQNRTIVENSPTANAVSARPHQHRGRTVTSPLPPLSRLSSFNVDLARLGLSSSSSSAPRRSPNSPALQTFGTTTTFSTPGNSAPTSPLYFGAHGGNNSRNFEAADRNSTLVGSESDGKGLAFGDEEDTDQSETVYDSLRSATTGSMRSHNAQLDSMFDESPPSLIATKTKRLSIHELLSGLRDGTDRIVEEDEGMVTPVKGARSRSSQEANLQTPVRSRATEFEDNIKSSPPSFSLASKEFGRLSLDDEEDDEDWTRDDDENPEIASLSHPSSSLNSRRASASFRAALADLTHNGSSINGVLPSIERPRSSLFDWSESSPGEKVDHMGKSPRPKTAHVKQIADGRGGRAVGRRAPNTLHIRSQSVPVVPDINNQREHSKTAPKFGTWGLGGKGVSEEWDGDFDFDSPAEHGEQGDTHMEGSGMVVPEAIQASQQQIVGHVGQIREVCVLVEQLKRLRQQGREKNLLDGESAHLWTEAEGIIALAVPDEEDPEVIPESPTSSAFGSDLDEDQRNDYGPDGEDLESPEQPFEVLNHQGLPTGFMYDGGHVRRRSVFHQSPDDDIFGAGTIIHPPIRDHLRPPSNSPRNSHKASSEYARSVMETMHQHRAVSDPLLPELTDDRSPNKMPFDTTSLRDLVNRASLLSRQLSDILRQSDGSQSPEARKDRDRNRDREESPAVLNLTRAFTPTAESTSGSPKHLPRSQSNNTMLNGSIDASPTRTLGQRMHMMTVI